MRAILIPVKEPARVKTRLAALLALEERQRLVWAMFEDVCRAVTQTRKVDAVFIVTSSDQAIRKARGFGFDAIVEAAQQSESASVDYASRVLGGRGFDTVLRLPADIPLLQAADIDGLFAVCLTAPAALLVPSFEGTGTNAILRTPPNLFPSRFGPNSLALHKEEAARVGVKPLIVDNANLALDIDEPRDVQLLLARNGESATRRLLDELRIQERLAAVGNTSRP